MAILSKQIGWSQESNLLWEILKKVDRLNGIVSATNGGNGDPVDITFAPSTAQDAFGRLRVSEPYTLFDSSNRYEDNGLWATTTSAGASSTFNANQGLIDLSVDGTINCELARQTYKVFAYQPGKSLLILNTFVMAPALVGLTQRVGYYTLNAGNGFLFQIADDDGPSFVKKSIVTGVGTETVVHQANWNGDKLDGTGPSGIILDPTKAQILWIDMEWLGVGSVRMGFVIDGQFILCHTFQHANLIDSTYITTACLPITYEMYNTGDTGVTSTLKQICSSVISEGGYELRGTQKSVGIPITTARTFLATNTYYPIVALKLKTTKLDSIVVLTAISVLGLGNGKNYAWRVVQGGTVTGGAWADTLVGTDSAVEYNITGTSVSGGRILATGYLNSSNQASPVVNILKGSLFSAQLERNGLTGTPLELILEVAVGSTSGGEGVFASMDWDEVTR